MVGPKQELRTRQVFCGPLWGPSQALIDSPISVYRQHCPFCKFETLQIISSRIFMFYFTCIDTLPSDPNQHCKFCIFFCLQIFRNCSVMYRSWLSLNLLLGLLGCFQGVVRVGWERGCRLFLSCSILPAPTLVLYSLMIWKGSMAWVDERAVLTVTLVCCYHQSSMCSAGIYFCVFVHYFSVPRTSVSVQLHPYFLIQI